MSTISGPKPTMRWNIVRKAENGLYYLDCVKFESGSSGAIVFGQIQQRYLSRKKAFSDRVSSLLCSPVVYTTTVVKGRHPTGSEDIEAQSSVFEVFVKNKRYSEAYTLALRDPARFEKEKTPNFLINRAQFEVSRQCEQLIHGLLVVQEIRHAKVVVLFGILALFSVGMGCLAGLVSGKVDVGVSVAAALFQFLTILQWSYIWVIRG